MLESRALTVLIADDTDSDRLILEAIVKKEGHQVISVDNGIKAVAAYQEHHPDLVLLDALMPVMDGFEAARQIKVLAGEDLVPVIFLTSLADTDSLVKCLEAGGDDFLSKPYSRVILKAKIKAFSRMREMHQMVQLQRDQIAQHNSHLMREQEVAKQIFDKIAHTGSMNAPNVRYSLSPLAIFNGDVIVAAVRPSGSMMVLLGDFTGHGLPAAIGSMPLSSIFYGMVGKGYSMVDILREINQKLKQILPVGVFCCATIVDMNFSKRKIKIWNGGLPDCYIHRLDSGAVDTVRSTHLPLGVLNDANFKDDCEQVEMNPGDRLYLWSDGIIESRNKHGEMFGEERLKQLFENNAQADTVFERILDAVHEYSDGQRDDDLSLIELTMADPGQLPDTRQEYTTSRYGGLQEWSMTLELKTSTLKLFDPLPLLLNILVEVPGLRSHSGTLYTLLAELYSNALEHGVLRLPSSWKTTSEGFERYYQERQKRMDALSAGFIRFDMEHQTQGAGGVLTIRVTDSGDGFEHVKNINNGHRLEAYSGRGIALIRSLSHSLRYLGNGNQVEVTFVWDADD
ncbi:fused response regulator/phosphatase [Aestuariicella hydrocarbonica]|uniref:Fused response regulator/phosphatase n=1 Tax=Pseudomaricurvus hydrocarbonicus TaxID=1470433 RepID=A0A9E5MMT0_9GAMM|nr:fused response regulator/phosphatase [Aestuariicella hydrocarbonica]NHO67117.1 fused response regulator/phosphatase [Aestuariicella hydrocarbonica]